MAQKVPQNFENHARVLPAYHYVAFPLFAINFLYMLYQAVTAFSWANLAGFGLVGRARAAVLRRARDGDHRAGSRHPPRGADSACGRCCPPTCSRASSEFSVQQLVALRFASDAELPALARKVLDEKIADQKAIKKMVTNWRADEQRA